MSEDDNREFTCERCGKLTHVFDGIRFPRGKYFINVCSKCYTVLDFERRMKLGLVKPEVTK